MKKILKEPLLHFLILGMLIFVGYDRLSPAQPDASEIVVTRGQQEHMVNVFMRTWQRPPTEQEFAALVRDHVREEIAFREGLAMGFDEGDTVIRRRMRQKLELLSDEIVGLNEPDDATLQAFLEQNADSFILEATYDLRHIYVSRDRRGDEAETDALELLAEVRTLPEDAWEALGDPLPLPDRFSAVRAGELERILGQQFSEGLEGLEEGVWSGPVESGFGYHLVMIDAFVPGRMPELDEVRERVKTEWFAQQRLQATEQLYEQLAQKYSIEIEPFSGDDNS